MEKYKILETDKGIVFERVDYKKISKVYVIDTENNKKIKIYIFNNVKLKEIPYLSWENLNCCGGWSYNEDYLYTAVQEGKKLYSDIGEYHKDESKFEKVVESIKDNKDICYESQSRDSLVDHPWNLYYICKKGCISDYINIDDVIENYNKLGVNLDEDEIMKLKRMCNTEMEEFKNEHNEFNHDIFNPLGKVSFIYNGLLLGYPLESTASFLA